jgi:hypothetical protein
MRNDWLTNKVSTKMIKELLENQYSFRNLHWKTILIYHFLEIPKDKKITPNTVLQRRKPTINTWQKPHIYWLKYLKTTRNAKDILLYKRQEKYPPDIKHRENAQNLERRRRHSRVRGAAKCTRSPPSVRRSQYGKNNRGSLELWMCRHKTSRRGSLQVPARGHFGRRGQDYEHCWGCLELRGSDDKEPKQCLKDRGQNEKRTTVLLPLM